MTENNTPECKYHQAKDIVSYTPNSPLDILSSVIKPQTWNEYILPALICIITLVHFIVFPQWDSFWISIIRLSLSILTILYITNIAHKAYNKRLDIIKSFNNNQPQFFTTIVVFGGMLAIFIPMIMNITKLIDNSALLTTALLTITGGIIAIFGYYITHQKSELEKEQMNMQKQKDARDHIRQLHDSYNDRFDKAVAELYSNDVKAAYAAVPKLAKLADAWLDYEDLSNDTKELEKLKDKAEKEAQIIINILCKYIRTIPNNYTHEQLKEFKYLPESDIEILTHEADIRRLIFSEISKRSSTFTKNGKGEIIETIPGIWSDFDFDFSRAPIFYPLNNLTIEQGNFASSRFYGEANFKDAKFTEEAKFRSAESTGDADFEDAEFTKNANFLGTKFTKDATFTGAEFSGNAYFWGAEFTGDADFGDAEFTKNAKFRSTKFTGDADFQSAEFTGDADFQSAEFTGDADFEDAEFTEDANFLGAKFTSATTFKHADFKQYPPIFANVHEFAQFSAQVDQKDYVFFSVKQGSQPIIPGTATLDGKSLKIPLGAVLFDSDSNDISEPAK